MKEFLKILKTSVIVCIGILLINAIFGAHDWERLLDVQLWGTYFFYSFVLTAINFLYFAFFEKKIGWEGAYLKKLVLAVAGSIILTMIGFFFCRMVDQTVFQGDSITEFLTNERAGYYLFPLLLTTIVSLSFHLIYFYKAIQEKKVTEQKIIAGTASAKFESLKNQIDPHFLFNSLNVLTSLIDENPEQAQKFTTGLSKIYRYVLEQKDKELVGLQEELNFAVTYMNLLSMRFENSIFYEVPKELSSPEARVVPLSLQLLLENTIKHNVVSDNKPLHIRIFEEDGYLVLENNLQQKEVLQKRKGVGLQNIINRYALITRREIRIIKDSDKFSVKIPVLTKQINIMKTQDFSENTAYFKARQRVKEIKEFYGNLLSYCLVIPFLIFINYQTYWEFQWFWFPMAGWGLGLTIHAFSVFGYGAHWEERKIQELMEKEQQRTQNWN
ncbi:2TM domain-containing protein [Salinimicrobium tongyeongense]|uniref:2TM domain-containing protein n=1 Tax=Salinimicrobium tongyeongense TaxID=2809707 RepID=A0ABY6NRS5_9FLAO|nr:2TM domain-containing protein [Salinimicrobium tongyeongense]UZH55248.1 2TM domain-containing protein [Salinimicrobium tongyeongense]